MTSESEIILFTKLGERFTEHLSDESNRQILFTGPFGSGKTTFLRTFFKDAHEFDVLHIFPVNYSLHHNADICEILKYDLILELIDKKAFTEVDISDLSKYVFAISQSTDKLFGKMFSMFSETGKDLTAAVDLLEKSESSILNDVKDLSDPLLQIKRFKGVIEKVKNYEYEDYITGVIKRKLASISPKKKKILIVDDLDRIDPDHLFRMISVFSAHIDHHTEENKFGFNKIIFVGDVRSFQEIYKHKFGLLNNFNAFISKLSSKTPFEFNPSKELFLKMPELLGQFKFYCTNYESEVFPMISFPEIGRQWLTFVICSLTDAGIISLRDLKKNTGYTINFINKRIPNIDVNAKDSEVYILLILIERLLINFDEESLLDKVIQNPMSVGNLFASDNLNYSYILSEMSQIPLSVIKHADIVKRDNDSIDHTLEDNLTLSKKSLGFKIERHTYSRNMVCRLTEVDATEANLIILSIQAMKMVREFINYPR